jgi:tetratricopeptide (TPR) repeat protein
MPNLVTTSPSETAQPISATGERIFLGSILALTGLVYAATLRFQFVYDDEGQIVENELIRSWRFVPQYFRGQVWQYLFPNEPANYYRPFNVLWFRINDAVFGLRPYGWHATAILLHVLATFLAYKVARHLTGRPLVAGLAALIFGVHPMRHEVVAWVSGTTESLWSVMFLMAFLSYLRSRYAHRAAWMALSCVLYGAALLSKETAAMLPAVVFAHAWIYGPRASGNSSRSLSVNVQPSVWRRVAKAAGLALLYGPVAAAYLVLRITVLHGFAHPLTHIPLRTLALTFPSVAFFYLRQWLVPIQLSEFYDLPLRSGIDFSHVVFPALAILLLAAALWFFRRELGPRETAFASVWTIVLLLPALDLGVFPEGELAHDRYFYLPSFGASLLLGLALEKMARGVRVSGFPRRWLVATAVLFGLLSYGTVNAASYWRNDYVLFEHAHRVAPLNLTAWNDYATALARRGDSAKAMLLLLQLLAVKPDYWLANYNYGRLSYVAGELPTAKLYLERARKIDPVRPDTYVQLGLIALKTNDLVEAEVNMRNAVLLRPFNPSFRFALGVVLMQRGTCSEARAQLEQALTLNPGFLHAQEMMNKCKAGSGLISAH